jgi:hypothetical protein
MKIAMMKQMRNKPMDSLDFIMLVEEEGFNAENPEQIKALQGMIDTGLIWKLQGSWGRFAQSMLNVGVVSMPENT